MAIPQGQIQPVQIVINQMAQPNVIYIDTTKIKTKPFGLNCPVCNANIQTFVKKKCNWYSCLLCYCAGLCTWITLQCCDSEKAIQNERESMFITNQYADDFFKYQLLNTEKGRAIGLAYFRKRGFRDDIIDKFHLGYCPDSPDALASAALAKGYTRENLIKTGLCYERENDGALRDRFHGRVIFPVHSLAGKIVAFGGRIMNADAKVAKYVNSPESIIYSKSRELYGLYQAKQAIVRKDRCFLVEGYADVISMFQSGVENVVASSGTSLTPGQIRLIHRFTNNITVLYDGDKAGIKESVRITSRFLHFSCDNSFTQIMKAEMLVL